MTEGPGRKLSVSSPFGPDDLMAVEEKVEVLDGAALQHTNGAFIHKILGGNQNLILAEHQLGHPMGEKDAVLRRYDEAAVKPERARLDHDRGIEPVACTLRDPSQRSGCGP
jgi:hypothetical protein